MSSVILVSLLSDVQGVHDLYVRRQAGRRQLGETMSGPTLNFDGGCHQLTRDTGVPSEIATP